MANANILKIKNEQGEWISVPAIKGDTGTQGPVGPQGPKGDPGEVTTQQMTDYVAQELVYKQDKLDSYSDHASVADDKLTINYKVKQEDGTYSNVPVEFQGGVPENMMTTDTEQNVTAVKTIIGNRQLAFAPNESSTSKWLVGTDNSRIDDFKIEINTSSQVGMSFYSPASMQFDQLYIGFNDNAGNARFKMHIPRATGQQIASFYPDTNWPSTLGQSNKKFTTIYCNNLSDGTTTKTMTDVLAGSTKKYRHIIRTKSSVAPTKKYCFEWISDKSTAYTYSEVDELISEFETAGLTSIENALPCIWGYQVDNNVATNLVAPIVYVNTTNPKHLLYVGFLEQNGSVIDTFAISSSNFTDTVIAI